MFNFSKAQIDDIFEIQEVAHTSWSQTYIAIIPSNIQEAFLEKAYSKESLLHRIKNTFFQVVFKDDSRIGFLNSSFPNKDGNVHIHA